MKKRGVFPPICPNPFPIKFFWDPLLFQHSNNTEKGRGKRKKKKREKEKIFQIMGKKRVFAIWENFSFFLQTVKNGFYKKILKGFFLRRLRKFPFFFLVSLFFSPKYFFPKAPPFLSLNRNR